LDNLKRTKNYTILYYSSNIYSACIVVTVLYIIISLRKVREIDSIDPKVYIHTPNDNPETIHIRPISPPDNSPFTYLHIAYIDITQCHYTATSYHHSLPSPTHNCTQTCRNRPSTFFISALPSTAGAMHARDQSLYTSNIIPPPPISIPYRPRLRAG
jgi:hypothetical protein